ncbi:hypothetical protein L1987_13221 [Smallanthus sonchifolius]|uniref:Uncharacterized protein n=1 Tax=Smallanthus sonchifolius TaxID=185202 RepID=A0ACB9JGJ0_9ASTR|nr:hypothetical protein L1987_13221 [Smallanthus sonchifolius]
MPRNAKEAKTENGDIPIKTSSLTEEKVICFDDDDRDEVHDPRHDGLVITLYIANHFIRRILIDGGSYVNIIQHEVLKKMGIPDSEIISKSSVLVGFSGETLDTRQESSTLNISPMCQDADPLGSGEDQQRPTRGQKLLHFFNESLCQILASIAINEAGQILVGSNIPEDIEEDILNFLRGRKATFAWKHEDMTGIFKDIITHKLGIDKSFRPIHQKRRKFAPERNVIIQKEVERLLKSGMIKEQ